MHAEQGAPVASRTVRLLATALDWPVDQAIAMATKIKREPVPSVTVKGAVAAAIRQRSTSAGQTIDDFLADLLNLKSKGKK